MLQKLLWSRAFQGAHVWGSVAGVVLDVIKKGYKGKRCEFARVALTITEHQLEWYRRDLQAAVMKSREVKWDSQVERRVTSCTRTSGGRRVPCTYQALCQFGKSASLDYRMGDGSLLTEHEGVNGVMPWE